MALEDFRVRFGKGMNELVLTAVLLLTIQLTVGSGTPGAPVAIGLVLVAIVYAGAPISGAHFNPAISLSVFLRGKMTFHEMLMYWVFQLIGGALGALLGFLIGGHRVYMKIGESYHFSQAFLAELVFTTILCFVVLGVATNSKTTGNGYYGRKFFYDTFIDYTRFCYDLFRLLTLNICLFVCLFYIVAIGIVITAGVYSVGDISGGGFNPAVALGLASMKLFFGPLYLLWVVIAQLLGGVLGAALFYIVAPDEFEHFNDEAHGIVDEARSLLQPGTDS